MQYESCLFSSIWNNAFTDKENVVENWPQPLQIKNIAPTNQLRNGLKLLIYQWVRSKISFLLSCKKEGIKVNKPHAIPIHAAPSSLEFFLHTLPSFWTSQLDLKIFSHHPIWWGLYRLRVVRDWLGIKRPCSLGLLVFSCRQNQVFLCPYYTITKGF